LEVTDDAEKARDAPGLLAVERYTDWCATPCPDPREGPQHKVMEGLCAIVAAEGPIAQLRAFRKYAKAAGLQRVGSEVRASLCRALHRAVRNGVLEVETKSAVQSGSDDVIRIAGSPAVRPRTAGSRSFLDIPRSELLWVVNRLREEQGQVDDERLIQLVRNHYGFSRLREVTKRYLANVLAECKAAASSESSK